MVAPSRLARLEREVPRLPRDNKNPRLPDGLAPSEAKVHRLASEPASPVRDKPVGGCGRVGGVGVAPNLQLRRGKPVGGSSRVGGVR